MDERALRQQIATAIGALEPDRIPEDYLSGDLYYAFTMGYQMAVSDAESVALGEV